MHNGPRRMYRIDSGRWMIYCRLCRKPALMFFSSAKECHDWWREHAQAGRHLEAVKRWPAQCDQRREMDALMREIFNRSEA